VIRPGEAGHRPDIDGLRALAVLPVIFYHADIPGFGGGFTGVDVFFVISGFLITHMIAQDLGQGRFSLLDFYARRVRRIVPALAVMLAAVTAAGLILFTPLELERHGVALAAAAAFVANIFFWRSANYFAAQAEPDPLLHTWSLAVEEQYYIFWPVALMALAWFGWRGRSFGLGVLALAGTVIAFAAALYMVRINPQFSFYMLPSRAWELLLGASLALGLADAWRTGWLKESAGALGVVLIVAGIVWLSAANETPGLGTLLPCLGAALVIFAGSGHSTLAGRILGLKPLVFVGLLSYSLYLWHWPLLVLPQIALARALTGVETAIALALSFVAAWMSWRFVERPFRRQSLSAPGMIRRFLAGGAIALGVLTLAGLLLKQAGGLPDRADAAANAADRSAIHDTAPVCLKTERPSGEKSELPPYAACAFGAADPLAFDAQTLLWGDSHANHLRGAMEAWAAEHGVKAVQMNKALCPPLLGATPFVPPRNRRADCVRFNEEIVRLVEDQRSIRQVVMAARWPVYVGLSYPRHGVTPILTQDGTAPARTTALAAFEAALDQTLSRLTKRGVTVVLVAPLPDFFQSPAKCVARARMLGAAQDRCGADAPTTLARLEPVTAILRKAAARHPGVTIVEPAGIFCAGAACDPVKGGAMVFRDDNHVTPLGAGLIVAKVPPPE
jgi:peptidoglycan/LPS O-acetylase OafA/YrhL